LRIPAPGPLEIHNARDLLDLRAQFVGDAVESVAVRTENLDLYRLRRALQVAQHVLEDLDELDVHARDLLGDLLAQVGDNLVHAALALRPGLQLDEDVALVLLSGEETQLGAGAAGEGRLLWKRGDLALNLVDQGVGLAERCPRWREVIDDEAAFIHLRQE